MLLLIVAVLACCGCASTADSNTPVTTCGTAAPSAGPALGGHEGHLDGDGKRPTHTTTAATGC